MSDKTNERGEPDEIWLQIHGDANPADYPDGPLPDLRGDDVTWCWEPIFEHDVKYVRADIVAALDKPAGPVGGEAVAWQYKMHECWHTTESDEPWRSKGLEVRPLYTHPAPPVVDEAALRAVASDLRHSAKHDDLEPWAISFMGSLAGRLTAALTQPSQPFTFQGIPIVENPDMAPDEVRVFNRPSQPGEEGE